MVPCYSLLNTKKNLTVHGFCFPSHYNGGDYWQDKTLWVKLKTNEGVIFLTLLLQKSEVFLLQISLGNVNA